MNPSENISNIRIASIQMVSTPVLQENLNTAARLIKSAAEEGAQLAVLPEYFCLMGLKDTDKVRAREPYGNGPIQEQLSAIAKDNGIYLVAGTIPLEAGDPQKVLNTTLVFNPYGETIARYDKIHLFGFQTETERYQESETIEAGNEPGILKIAIGTQEWIFGLSICYDLRFPELYRLYADQGAHLLLVPSAFTYGTGQAHWDILLRSRAIENLAFVAAAAQGGVHENGRRTWGHSLLVDPWGGLLAEREEGAGVVCAELEFDRLSACRAQLPALGDRVL